MKKQITLFMLAVAGVAAISAQQSKWTDGKDLTMVGKVLPTHNIYHRIDTVAYKGFTALENQQIRCSAGLALAFETNSPYIKVAADFAKFKYNGASTPRHSSQGFDLYIKKDGQWLWAGINSPKNNADTITIVNNMDRDAKECLLYLPMYSELNGVHVGVADGSEIKPIPNPFRHKIVIFGSSFTHGISTSRAGMSYPMQIERMSGLQFCSIACSGNCKLQTYFAEYLADVSDADAMVFDAFSNPKAPMIRERLIPFIRIIREKQPDIPLIFVNTIYRERSNFDAKERASEDAKRQAAREMMQQAMKEFKNVYFIDIPDLTGSDHVTSADGTHPTDLGYFRWANNLAPELLRILAIHGIK